MNPPQVIFLDAVGTLFGVRASVGRVYGDLARQVGVDVDDAMLNQAFFESFRASSPMAFPGVPITELAQHEFDWWQAIATQTFQGAGVFDQFADFPKFFAGLYAHFATAEPWVLYPDVYPALKQWRSQGIALGVLSNFDSRLHAVLPALGLDQFFDSVTISTEANAAKPDAQMFAIALKKHDGSPDQAWHIGDSFKEDYQGATQAGLRGIWLNREDDSVPTPLPGDRPQDTITTLLNLNWI